MSRPHAAGDTTPGGFVPREQQKAVLAYRGGLLGVSAVPGSGKTMTISALAATLIAETPGGVPPDSQVLVVTYQNAAVDAVRARIAAALKQRGLFHGGYGYEVRTLHSLAYDIVRANPGLAGTTTDFTVLDGRAQEALLRKAVRIWNNQHPDLWEPLFPGGRQGDPLGGYRREWSDIIRKVTHTLISTAKNLRLGPNEVQAKISAAESEETAVTQDGGYFFFRVAADIYRLYQQQVETVGGLDFDDLVWMAVELLEGHADLRERLRRQWYYILEDEAQDSVPLQEELLGLLAGDDGNWVRVGDPNQAIMSTFTAADPRYLRRFLMRDDVEAVTLPVSGRSAPKIIDLANHLVSWVCEDHPVPEVRDRAFRDQMIEPTAPGDPQQNPSDDESIITFRTYSNRTMELTDVARRANAFTASHPHMTVGILVPTNRIGYDVAEMLRTIGADFDEFLRSSTASRQVAEVLSAVLGFLANPIRAGNLETAYDALRDVLPELRGADPLLPEGRIGDLREGGKETTCDPERVATLLRSSSRVESLLYPAPGTELVDALVPVPGITSRDVAVVEALARFLRHWMRALTLPVDQLVMTIAQDLFSETKLATAQKLASYLRSRAEQNVDWRLPELARELELVAAGRSAFIGLSDEEYGFEPVPGKITLTTMHRAKGLEWDLVYLVGVDGTWFPHTLEDEFMGEYEALGGDPSEEAKASLLSLVGELTLPLGDAERDDRSATEMAHVDVIAERLRLLYVGITRARRYLAISWSREVQYGMQTRTVPWSEAYVELRKYCEEYS